MASKSKDANIAAAHPDCGAPWSAVDCGSVVELVERACRRAPTQAAMVFEDGLAVTRQQLLDAVERFAGYLAAHTTPGDRIAVMLETRAESMIAQLAALAARCVVVPVNPTAKAHDAGHILRDSAAAMAIVSVENNALIDRLRAKLPALREIVVLRAPEPNGLAAYEAGSCHPRLGDCRATRADIATIHYTSGTTGPPKGCMLAHEWWLRLCDVHLRMTPHEPHDRLLCCVPFYYPDSLFLLLSLLHAGDALVVMRRFSASRFWQTVAEHRVTLLYLIASMPILLLKQAPNPRERAHRLRSAVCLGVPANLHAQLHDRFGVPFIDTYGSTEAGWVTRMPRDRAADRVGSGSMGTAAPEVELRVVDDAEADVPAGQAGELLVRAPGLFAGYLNQPEATAAALRGGWYRTGDLVRADAQGLYYFLGRKKDMVRRGGENIAAAEVEEVLRTHPKIRDAAVIPVPDEIRGEEVKAYVLLAEGCETDELPPEEIVAHCTDRLAAFKVPRYIEYRTDDFPAHTDDARAQGGAEGGAGPHGQRLGPRAPHTVTERNGARIHEGDSARPCRFSASLPGAGSISKVSPAPPTFSFQSMIR
jgi:acyl-CoA synthetase (AMP-forming)/AMP-acid ligase II